MLSALVCLIVGVADGNTLNARCPQPGGVTQHITVQVHAIAAPHLRQNHGPKARQHLAELCYLQQAKISYQESYSGTERSARVTCREKDVAAHQVTSGMAWMDPDLSMERADLNRLERDARVGRRGLWADLNPVPPWQWQRIRVSKNGD